MVKVDGKRIEMTAATTNNDIGANVFMIEGYFD